MEATIKIPGNIDIKKISDDIVYKAFAIAIEKKRKELQNQLKQIESKIKKFEKKHKMNFTEYENSMGDSFQHHNDWIDWGFLIESKNQLLEELENFKTH